MTKTHRDPKECAYKMLQDKAQDAACLINEMLTDREEKRNQCLKDPILLYHSIRACWLADEEILPGTEAWVIDTIADKIVGKHKIVKVDWCHIVIDLIGSPSFNRENGNSIGSQRFSLHQFSLHQTERCAQLAISLTTLVKNGIWNDLDRQTQWKLFESFNIYADL